MLPMSSSSILRPLSPGDTVSTGFRLYRSHFRTYFMLALRGTLWILLPLVGLILLGVLIGAFSTLVKSNPMLTIAVLFSLSLIAGLIFLTFNCLGRFFLNMTLISRLAYGELTNRPETVAQGRQILKPLTNQIRNTFVLTIILLVFINLSLTIVSAPLTAILTSVFRLLDSEWMGIALANVVTFALYTWVSARFFVIELPIALEGGLTAFRSIQRSWALAQGSLWRILMVSTIAFLVTIPLYTLASVPPIIGAIGLIPVTDTSYESAIITRFLPGLVVGAIVFLVMNMMVMGFWQATKAVVYYDLRSRREGSDIQFSRRSERSENQRGNYMSNQVSNQGRSHIQIPSPAIISSEIGSSEAEIETVEFFIPDSTISEQAKSVLGQLLEQVDFTRLSPQQWYQVRDYLHHRDRLDPSLRAQKSLELARHCRETIGLQKLPQKMTGDVFLEALYWAIVSTGIQI